MAPNIDRTRYVGHAYDARQALYETPFQAIGS